VTFTLDLEILLEYTEWQRQRWHAWLGEQGDQVLQISAGPHGDGRFQSIGEVIRHIFSAEKRYIDRLSRREITDTSTIPNDSIETLFGFGKMSREALRVFVGTCPEEAWDVAQEYMILDRPLTLTPKKIIIHVLMHEVRHWAQIATLLRIHGRKVEFHDFLFSPVLGDVTKGAKGQM